MSTSRGERDGFTARESTVETTSDLPSPGVGSTHAFWRHVLGAHVRPGSVFVRLLNVPSLSVSGGTLVGSNERFS